MADADVSELLTAMHRIDVLRLSEEHKHELKVATSALSLALETPWEITMRIVWQEPSVHACICTLIDLEVFKRWVAECEEVRSCQELAELVGCDSRLMNRLLRNLASNGLLVNCGSQNYAMTEFTRSLAQTKHIAAFSYFRNLHLPMLTALPTYLASTKYQDSFLKHPTSTAFNQALGTKDGLFDYLSKHPDQERDFGHCMEAVSGSVPSWIEIYPTESSLVKSDGQRDDVVVVDVGGSISHDLNAFQRKHRLQPGRLVLQDLAEVLEGARVESGITKMPHDFFTDQTVEARIFYLHSVLHDWPDKEACRILQHMKPAMQKGRSKILIHEIIVGRQSDSKMATWMDITMLAAFNSGERSFEQWEAIVTGADMRISDIRNSCGTPYSILELELA